VAVVNVHHPANTRRAPKQGRFRAEALRREAAVVRALRAEGLDVLLLGDFNDRRRAYCTFVTRLGMEASHRGGSGDGCRPPREALVDWIFATDELDLRDHTSVGRTLAGISDHQLVVARVER
jgi:endonuclease/exonuclease/phosphatase family metal-dependent hydrolase